MNELNYLYNPKTINKILTLRKKYYKIVYDSLRLYDKQLQIKYMTTRTQKVPLSDSTG